MITSFPPTNSFIIPYHTGNLNWYVLNICQIKQKFPLKTNIKDYQDPQILTYLTFSQVTKHMDLYIKVKFFFFWPTTFFTTTQIPCFFLEQNMCLNKLVDRYRLINISITNIHIFWNSLKTFTSSEHLPKKEKHPVVIFVTNQFFASPYAVIQIGLSTW